MLPSQSRSKRHGDADYVAGSAANLKSWDEAPPKARRPARDLGNTFTTCQAISFSRRYGWILALGREDSSCVLGAMALGLEKRLPHYTDGNLCIDLYTESLEAGRLSEESVPKLREGAYVGVVTAPLAKATFTPDVVIIYGNSAQIMRLGQAVLWKRGGVMNSVFRGRIDCADLAIAPKTTGEAQMVVPCHGRPDHRFRTTRWHSPSPTPMIATHAAEPLLSRIGSNQASADRSSRRSGSLSRRQSTAWRPNWHARVPAPAIRKT